MDNKKAIIIGAGPAGLTAAFELLKNSDIKPIVFEKDEIVGGISKTIVYNNNRVDIGGHRYFSKREDIMSWLYGILPLQGSPAKDYKESGKKIELSQIPGAPDPEKTDKVMLIRERVSRILLGDNLVDYPITMNYKTINQIGFTKIFKIILSYVKAHVKPIKKEVNLDDFFINRFGRELYLTFFKEYTEKVWGVSVKKINAKWGYQRIKGLSLLKSLLQSIKDKIINNKNTLSIETSLIKQFAYPKLGAGQLWEEVEARVLNMGGEVYKRHELIGITIKEGMVENVIVLDKETQQKKTIVGDYFISTMPIDELIERIEDVPDEVREISNGLIYRDHILASIIVRDLQMKDQTSGAGKNKIIPDDWIYIPSKDLKLSRIQIFNNWSPYLVKDINTVSLGLEFICSEGDDFWRKTDVDIVSQAKSELEKIGLIEGNNIVEYKVIRTRKAYPCYFGTYEKFNKIIDYMNGFENLFLIGRNGMYRYNNLDHAMLTAMAAVENIVNGIKTKENIWKVNSEDEYHEE